MYLARMSEMPLTVSHRGAPDTTFRSQTTSAAACMGMDFFCPSMMIEQMLAVKPSELASVGTATNGMPRW